MLASLTRWFRNQVTILENKLTDHSNDSLFNHSVVETTFHNRLKLCPAVYVYLWNTNISCYSIPIPGRLISTPSGSSYVRWRVAQHPVNVITEQKLDNYPIIPHQEDEMSSMSKLSYALTARIGIPTATASVKVVNHSTSSCFSWHTCVNINDKIKAHSQHDNKCLRLWPCKMIVWENQ
jgi:hypothetical protein